MATRTPKPKIETAAPVAEGPAESTVSSAAVPEGDEGPLKLKGLVEAVVDRTGQRKGEVRTAIQAALAVLGEAIAEEQEINLPQFGKLKVTRARANGRGRVMTAKLVQNQRPAVVPTEGDDALAQTAQDV